MLSDPQVRQTSPGSIEEFYTINENLDEYVDNILKSLDITPIKITKLGGSACINLKIETESDKFVLKISPYDGILQVAEYFYRSVRALNFDSPEVNELDRSKSIIPFEYMLMEFIEGQDLNSLNSNKHLEAGIIVGSTLKKIHPIIISNFDNYIADYTKWDYSKWQKILGFYIKTYPHKSKEKLFSQDEIEYIENLINSPFLVISEPHLLHGDVHGENCLFNFKNDELKLKALIDPNTLFGDPMFDLANAEVLTVSDSQDFYKGIRQGYGQLTENEQKRLEILKVIFMYWLIKWRYNERKDINLHMSKFKEYLSQLS